MSAYLIANVRVIDAAQYEQYKKLSTLAMQAHGAEVCVRDGAAVDPLHPDPPLEGREPQTQAIAEDFP